MRCYVNEIIHQIDIQVKNSEKLAIVKLEGFDSVKIYKDICNYFLNSSNINCKAKLSNEKYKEFNERCNDKERVMLKYLEEKGCIDSTSTMTRWRNESADYNNDEKKTLVLLMGTEVVQDKGGLLDFYKISPESILHIIKKDYSVWFKEIFRERNIDEKYLKSIDTLFKVIFNNINVDLVKLSDLIDEIDSVNVNTIQEIIEEICFKLNEYWNIPSIKNNKQVPKANNLLKGTLKSGDIIEKSFKFISRSQFKKGINKKTHDKYKERIDKYAEENKIDLFSEFPYDERIFTNYEEFKTALLDFIEGKNYSILKEKFLKIDFSLINKILNLKLVNGDKKTKDKQSKVFGEPLEVYIKMITEVILDYKKIYNKIPQNVEVIFNGLDLSGVNTDEERNSMITNIYVNIAGILEYLNSNKSELEFQINIGYQSNEDPFKLKGKNMNELSEKVTVNKKMNALSKIEYTIRGYDDIYEDDRRVKKQYIYCFSTADAWISDFFLINNSELIGIENSMIKLPLYLEGNNINEFINSESDEEFFVKLSKIKHKVCYEEYVTYLDDEVDYSQFRNEFGNLRCEYEQWMIKLNEEGIYSTFVNNNECQKVFKRYSNMLKVLREGYDNLISTQKEAIDFVLRMFLIGDKKFCEFKKDRCTALIIPPYHPIMLEKIYYKKQYLKTGFEEIIQLVSSCSIKDENVLEKRLEYYRKMCHITSGFDAIYFNRSKLISSEKMYGNYAVYSEEMNKYSIISDGSINDLSDDDIDKKELLRKTHKSNIITQNIIDYIKTFPAKMDGINIAFINPDDMQHVVAGIHGAVNEIKEYDDAININIRILLSNDRRRGAEYLKFWLDNCFEDDFMMSIRTRLNYIDFNSNKLESNIEEIMELQDLIYIYKVLDETEISFVKAGDIDLSSNECKYPAMYTPMPISLFEDIRKVDISQRQFEASNEHLQLTHKIMRPDEIEAVYRVVKKLKIVEEKKKLIDMLHKKSNWVICLDETVDKSLLNSNYSKIIGFSTGKGAFGELNTTVSARESILIDLQSKLRCRLMAKFKKWLPEMADKAAANCIDISKKLDGSKMLKALNPNDYEIHNYLAYVLTMQSIRAEKTNDFIIKNLINLDNYMHWFDNNLASGDIRDGNLRPDFLVLEVKNDETLFDKNVPLRIKATVIECKMAKENKEHIEEAKKQLVSGLEVLANNFSPINRSINSRYWYNQLYRALIFSKINIQDNEKGYDILINKISNIYEGKFEIEWNGYIYAYWIDRNDGKLNVESIREDKKFKVEVNKLQIYTAGQLYIQRLLLPQEERNSNVEFNEEVEKDEEIIQFLEEVLEGKDDVEELKPIELQEDIEENNDIVNSMIINSEKTDSIVDVEVRGMDTSKEKVSVIIEENIYTKEKDPVYTKFLLGEDIRTNEKIYWEYTHKDLNNRHLLINGNSGSGKTYCIQTLILEAVKNNISVIVFDYTDGFTKSKLSPILLDKLGGNFEERFVRFDKFPINPFRKGVQIVNEHEREELDQDVAMRISSSFKNVYDLGEQQVSAVYTAVRNGLKQYGSKMSLERLADELGKDNKKPAQTTLSKIIPLVDYEPFSTDEKFDWSNVIEAKGKMYVIQLSGYDRMIQLILTDLILWDIWNYAVKNGNESNPIPLVLDEAQNLSHDEKSPSGKILAEGRKFGLSGWYATQFMKGRLNAAEIGNLQQSAQKLYFSPPEESIKEVASYIDITSDGSKLWAEKLSKLTKGNCVTVGYKVNRDRFDKYKPRIIKITSLEDRIND